MSGDHAQALGKPLAWQPVEWPSRQALRGRLILVRPLDAAADAEHLYRVSHPPHGDPSIWTYLFDGPYESPEALRARLSEAQSTSDPLFFSLLALPEEEPQGVASYLRITPDHGVIEIGHIWFGTPLQRTPAATEAIYLLIRHAFDELGYRRVEWKCNALNARSRRAAERFGFTFEGIFRQHMVIKDRNRDTAWFAITDGEWPGVRDGFERWLDPKNFDPGGRQRLSLGEVMAKTRSSE